jgi:hypothetical protein
MVMGGFSGQPSIALFGESPFPEKDIAVLPFREGFSVETYTRSD